jgi:hypothetical protein
MVKPKSHSGQSLVEVLVALGVALLVIVALIRATAISMKGSGFSKTQARGTRYAQEAIEWIRGQRDEGWSNLNSRTPDTGLATYCLNDLSSWPASSGECTDYSLDVKFKREAVLSNEGGGKIGVVVTVKWLEVGGERQSRLNTYFTNWRGSIAVTTGTPTPTPAPATFEARVNQSSDDAEEYMDGTMASLTSSDLEIDWGREVGIRFRDVDIEQGANIANAYIQFQADESNSEATSLAIRGEDIDDAPTFTSSNFNISSRSTTAPVLWSPPPWSTGEAGLAQRTPNISSIIQMIVNRGGWSSGNSLVIIITGSGRRVAESWDGVATAAPLLHVEYTP